MQRQLLVYQRVPAHMGDFETTPMQRQLLVYVSCFDPDFFVVTPPHLAHQAHVDFYWSASDDRLTLVPKERAREILAEVQSADAEPAFDEGGTCCHAA